MHDPRSFPASYYPSRLQNEDHKEYLFRCLVLEQVCGRLLGHITPPFKPIRPIKISKPVDEQLMEIAAGFVCFFYVSNARKALQKYIALVQLAQKLKRRRLMEESNNRYGKYGKHEKMREWIAAFAAIAYCTKP